jgi:hypothetical protein
MDRMDKKKTPFPSLPLPSPARYEAERRGERREEKRREEERA